MKLKILSSSRFFLVFFAVIVGCSSQNIKYDKVIKTFNFEKSYKKTALAILYFTDARSEVEKLGVETVTGKSSLRNVVTKLSEEMLIRSEIFSSVSIITGFDLPDFYDEKSLENFRKKFGVDYALGGGNIRSETC